MTIAEDEITGLPSCKPGCESRGTSCESREALLWLNQNATEYPSGMYIPPMEPLTKNDDPKSFISVAATMKRTAMNGTGTMISQLEYSTDAITSTLLSGHSEEITTHISESILAWNRSGYLIVFSGRDRNVLDIFLEQFGPGLVELGYSLQPFLSDGDVSFIKIRKDRRSWQLCYAENISGASLDTLHGYARDAGSLSGHSTVRLSAPVLYSVIDAYQRFLLETFGVAINPTIGMTALRCARRFLPEGFKRWRPPPLLAAMERIGKGYRGGMTYAERYRGPSLRIDVVRQYTSCLTEDLPYRVAFGRYNPDSGAPGVFLCTVSLSNTISYPLGVWSGKELGFVPETCTRGTYLSVLHTSEFPGLEAAGALIRPYYGYTYTATFTLAPYVERLQRILSENGRDSAVAKLTKPLGNYVYGKFGQKPDQKELIFSDKCPGDLWYPYVDSELTEWTNVWERKKVRYTSTQLVDIAGTITGAARSQTVSMWAWLQSLGLRVVRCHTDSLTVVGDIPGELLQYLSDDDIGMWRIESTDTDTIIVGTNAYVDQDGAHIAGVSNPTVEMIERVYDGQISYAWQDTKTPLRGFSRERRMVKRSVGS